MLVDASALDWRSAAWLLERGWPSEYGRPYREFAPEEQESEIAVKMVFNTGNKSVEELLNFPEVKSLPEKSDDDADEFHDDDVEEASDNGAEESFANLQRRGLV